MAVLNEKLFLACAKYQLCDRSNIDTLNDYMELIAMSLSVHKTIDLIWLDEWKEAKLLVTKVKTSKVGELFYDK